MGAVHLVGALQMDAAQLEGRLAFQIGMKELMQHHEHGRSSKNKKTSQDDREIEM